MNEKLFYSPLSCYCKKTLNLSADNEHNEIKLDPVKLLIISGSYIYFLFAQEKTIISLFRQQAVSTRQSTFRIYLFSRDLSLHINCQVTLSLQLQL